MGDQQRTVRTQDMASTSTAVTTIPAQLSEESVDRVAVITLRPTRAQPRKKVVWTEDTVDNEHMNKKKSKCCCIYEKPRRFGESDSEDSDDECEHCFGHVERRHKHTHTHTQQPTATEQVTTEPESSASLVLKPPELTPPDDPPAQTD